MINKIIEGLFNFIFGFVDAFTQPISDLLINNIPDLSNMFTAVNSFLNSILNFIAYFVYLIPPFTKSCLLILLYVIVSTASIVIFVYVQGHILNFIKRFNIFGGK